LFIVDEASEELCKGQQRMIRHRAVCDDNQPFRLFIPFLKEELPVTLGIAIQRHGRSAIQFFLSESQD
jgi:hypothetical protein